MMQLGNFTTAILATMLVVAMVVLLTGCSSMFHYGV